MTAVPQGKVGQGKVGQVEARRVEVRPMVDGEQAAFARSVSIPFLDAGNEDAALHWSRHLEVGRSWVAEDRGRIVGQSCTFTRDVTVPGPTLTGSGDGPCPVVPMTAVSGVGVHPTHRRLGLLSRMMAEMLEDGRRRGEPVATLLASESVIYGRYGFGLAVSMAQTRIDPARSAFRADLDPGRVGVELLDADEAAKVLPALHDRCRARRAGDVSRDDATWQDMWADAPSHRDGMSAWMYAVAEDGFAVYRGAEASGAEPDRVSVRLLYGADDATEAALFRFLADIDLVDRLDLGYRPLDDPLRWRLADPRRLETTGVTDFLWVRILDTAAALTARHYAGTGRLVLDVVAPAGAAPDPAVGRWVLDAGPDGTTCVPAGPGERTDLRLGLTELGALYLGGVAPSVLRSAGRIDEERPGALAVADRLFPTPMAPRSGTGF